MRNLISVKQGLFRVAIKIGPAAFAFALLTACGKDEPTTVEPYDLVVTVSDPTLNLVDSDPNQLQDRINGAKDSDIKQCEMAFDDSLDATSLKVAGSTNGVQVIPTEALMVKMTGNKNTFTMQIAAAEGTENATFEGVCFVLAGNQPNVSMRVTDVTLNKFKVVASGNEGSVTVSLNGSAEIMDSHSYTTGNDTIVSIEKN